MQRGWSNEAQTARRDAIAPAAGIGGLPRVSGLESGIIPQQCFPLRKWYYANPLWYYHAPAFAHHLHADNKFFELVDPALRELCQRLLRAGLCTTPSCQGHFYARERFERIWDELLREADAIRGAGLVVRDSETHESLCFHDSSYQMAWPEFDVFLPHAVRHQNQGYIGIAVPHDRAQLAVRLGADDCPAEAVSIRRDDDLSRLFGQHVFGVSVDPETPEQRDTAWHHVTRHVCDILAAE